ncbi:MAG: pyruvate kinase alpha/beta domain-containing protein, partial [Acidimicrobiales bacterium]
AVSLGLVAAGDLVLLVAGLPFGVSGTTNLLKIQKVGDPIFDASEQRTREERTSYV